MYGKTLEILPMKAQALPKKKGVTPAEHRKQICESGEYFAQEKKDGAWYVYEKDIKGNSFLFSRVISKETGHLSEKSGCVPHIMEWLDSMTPNGTILIGEMYYPDGKSNDTTSIMGCDPYKAQVRQGLIPDDGTKEWKKCWKDYEFKGLINYYIFDILYWAGKSLLDKTNEERYNILAHETTLLGKPFIEIAEVVYENLEQYIDDTLESGKEGVVLKKKTALYEPDKKPAYNWIKFKQEDEADVICMGYVDYDDKLKIYDGKEIDTWQFWEDTVDWSIIYNNPKSFNQDFRYIPVKKPYAMGWKSALKIGVFKDGELVNIGTTSSGLTDKVLADIKENPDYFIGKPLAVKYMESFEGALRHSSFVRWRIDDINDSDCTWDKIFK